MIFLLYPKVHANIRIIVRSASIILRVLAKLL